MKLTFLGAAHEVTGSCYLLEVGTKQILIDCGMEQGVDLFENQSIPYPPSEIDMVFLTHAHIDHSGKIPMLYANGFKGKIYSTSATHALCEIMLRDSAHIQEFEAEWRSRKAKRAGEEPYVPLYTVNDAIGSLNLFMPCEYDKDYKLCDEVSIKFIDAGHLLGSASIEVTANEDNETRVIVFSGDIGNINKPILRDPIPPKKADYLVMESTYGDRYHGDPPDYVRELTDILQRTFDRGGNVVVPSFAVGRTQEMLYFLRQIKQQNLVKGHNGFTVVVDSPLAVEATNVFKEDGLPCYDEETMKLVKKGINPISFDGLKTSVTAEESKLINADNEPKVILSASGMCEAGRIRHHLKHNLWREECTILFVGYQSPNTIGRALLDGAPSVKLFGEKINVNAEITMLHSISGHADCNGLVRWAKAVSPSPKRVFVTHGDDKVCDALAEKLENEEGLISTAPYSGDAWDLISGKQIDFGNRKKVEKKKTSSGPSAYDKLVSMGQKLLKVIEKNKGGTNKDLAKFSNQIQSLCDKWDRQ